MGLQLRAAVDQAQSCRLCIDSTHSHHSVDSGEDTPLPLHGLVPKLLPVPFPVPPRGNAEYGGHEHRARKDRRVHQRPSRRRDERDREVYRQLGGVVRTDDATEERVRWQRVLLQTRQVDVAVVLRAAGDEEHRQPDERLERGRIDQAEQGLRREPKRIDRAYAAVRQHRAVARRSHRRGLRTSPLDPDGHGHGGVEQQPDEVVRDPHATGTAAAAAAPLHVETLVQPARDLREEARPREDDLLYRHRPLLPRASASASAGQSGNAPVPRSASDHLRHPEQTERDAADVEVREERVRDG